VSIVRRPSALEDLVDLAAHIALDNIEAAGRFIRAAEEAFHDLDRMPFMGSPREYRDPGISGIRMWPIKGFRKHLIFYRPIEDGIEIVRVIHSSRDIAALFGEDE